MNIIIKRFFIITLLTAIINNNKYIRQLFTKHKKQDLYNYSHNVNHFKLVFNHHDYFMTS